MRIGWRTSTLVSPVIGSTVVVCWASSFSGSSGMLSAYLPFVLRDAWVRQFLRRSSGKSQSVSLSRPVLAKPIKANLCFFPTIVGR